MENLCQEVWRVWHKSLHEALKKSMKVKSRNQTSKKLKNKAPRSGYSGAPFAGRTSKKFRPDVAAARGFIFLLFCLFDSCF